MTNRTEYTFTSIFTDEVLDLTMEVKVFPVQMLIIYTLLFYSAAPDAIWQSNQMLVARANLVLENVDKVAANSSS
jgi:hypothetical protein